MTSPLVIMPTTLTTMAFGASHSLLASIAALAPHVRVLLFVLEPCELGDRAHALGAEVVTAQPTARRQDLRYLRRHDFPAILGSYLRLLRNRQPRLVHLLNIESMSLLGWLPRMLGLPVVTTLREEYFPSLLNLGASAAHRIVTVSAFARTTLPPRLQGRARVVFNAVSRLPELRPPPDRPERIVVACPGRFIRDKGMDLLVSALPHMRTADRVEIRLVGAGGDGPPQVEAELRAQADALPAHLRPRLRILPWTTDIASVLDAADIVAVPSRWQEAFGRVALEAQAHGRPVVATARGGLPEVVTDGVTGLLARPEDPAHLASRLDELVGAPDRRRRMGEAARAAVEDRFGPSLHRRALLAVYQELTGTNGWPEEVP